MVTSERIDQYEQELDQGYLLTMSEVREVLATLRAAWAERDEARGHVVWWHGEWCKASDEITRLRAAAPVPTGWVPVAPSGRADWPCAAHKSEDAWEYLLFQRARTRGELRRQGWRVVPCAALTGEEGHDAE